MKKNTRKYRWAVVNDAGEIVRDVRSHNRAIYSDRDTAHARNTYDFTPMGSRVKRISVSV